MIVKTRHLPAIQTDPQTPLSRNDFGQGCGVLRHSNPPGAYRHVRYAPPRLLAEWVQHFWIESWDWEGRMPQVREVLPHPCVQLVFASGRSRVYGVQLRRFVRELKGRERILGIKFRAGAFYPFLREPVSTIADSSLPLQQLFDAASAAEQEVLACHDDAAMVEAAARFLAARLPPKDPATETACAAVEEIAADPGIHRVEDLILRHGIQERALQRLFRRYVGASARWVIKRYRIYEALQHLSSGSRLDWASLAQDLGYFDQAHFISDFKKLVGRTPAAYLKT
jgi:AraC-like DNA-binding protein